MITHEHPYKHIQQFDFLPVNEYQALCNCLQGLEWELYDKGSYKYKVSSIDYETECYKNNKSIVEKFISQEFIQSLSSLLCVEFSKCKDFTFHKMDIGDFSLKHTDKNSYGEIARVVYYLSEPNSFEGGNLNLFDVGGKYIYEKLRMPSNSFLSFRLTDDFYHEVETITKGIRYCISISYSK
jgi:Rps23 Pro-64 3,4-dihydroxylase Tpa1-like proline 4-hydroxylase